METHVHLKVIMAVLQVCAKCGQQLDAVGGDLFGIFLLQVSKANCSVRLTLRETPQKTFQYHIGCQLILEMFCNSFMPILHLDYFCYHQTFIQFYI